MHKLKLSLFTLFIFIFVSQCSNNPTQIELDNSFGDHLTPRQISTLNRLTRVMESEIMKVFNTKDVSQAYKAFLDDTLNDESELFSVNFTMIRWSLSFEKSSLFDDMLILSDGDVKEEKTLLGPIFEIKPVAKGEVFLSNISNPESKFVACLNEKNRLQKMRPIYETLQKPVSPFYEDIAQLLKDTLSEEDYNDEFVRKTICMYVFYGQGLGLLDVATMFMSEEELKTIEKLR